MILLFVAFQIQLNKIHKKTNPPEVVFKNILKFDTQNPIIGSLLTQNETSKLTSKLTDQKVNKFLGKARSTKDIEIKEVLKNLKSFFFLFFLYDDLHKH